jgi:hypothetical protein
MRLRRTVVSVLVCVLLLGLAAGVSAGPPPQGGDPLPGDGGFGSAPMPPIKLVRDRETGVVIYAELAEPAQAEQTAPVPKPDEPATATFRAAGSEAGTLTMDPVSTVQPQNLLIGNGGRPDEEIGVAASTVIESTSFEGTFPTGDWQPFGNLWGQVDCFPLDGTSSVWPAVDVADPCIAADDYPANVDAWLDFGPFSLADAQSASLDFFYRSDIQNTQNCDNPVAEDCDYLFWGASIDGFNFFGDFDVGTHVGGPFLNGYNFASLDLSFVAGEPEVWISFNFTSNSDAVTGEGPFIDVVALRKNTDRREIITFQNFDSDVFPNPSWFGFDNDGPTNGEYWWDDVQCFSRSGDWSMWPADDGADGLDPCFTEDPYANNMKSWLEHGPFDLTGASEAWVDFYFRNQSESGADFLYWGASIDGFNFYGPPGISGSLAAGPDGNGYNRMRFDLSNVFILGDLRGQPEVWLAFIFESDSENTDQGPFIDDVSVVAEIEESQVIPKTFLPMVLKNPSPTTRLHITNETGGTLSYTVKNTPEGAKSCSVADGQVKLCATFTSGTYDWEATAHCGSTSGTRTFPPGDDYPKAFECQ